MTSETDKNAERTARLLHLFQQFDDEAQVVLLHTIRLVVAAKSKSWVTRRLNDFGKWYRSREAGRPN